MARPVDENLVERLWHSEKWARDEIEERGYLSEQCNDELNAVRHLYWEEANK